MRVRFVAVLCVVLSCVVTSVAQASFFGGCSFDAKVLEVFERSAPNGPKAGHLKARFTFIRAVSGFGHARPSMCDFSSAPERVETLTAEDAGVLAAAVVGTTIRVALKESDGRVGTRDGRVKQRSSQSWHLTAPKPAPVVFAIHGDGRRVLHVAHAQRPGCPKRSTPPRWMSASVGSKALGAPTEVKAPKGATMTPTWQDIKAFGKGMKPLESLVLGPIKNTSPGGWYTFGAALGGPLRGWTLRLDEKEPKVTMTLQRTRRQSGTTSFENHDLGALTIPKAVMTAPSPTVDARRAFPSLLQVSLLNEGGPTRLVIVVSIRGDGTCAEGRVHHMVAPLPEVLKI